MSYKSTFQRIVVCAAAMLMSATIASAGIFEWQDNFVGYRYGESYREPYNPNKITKNIFQFQHADSYKWGSNFLNVDALISSGGATGDCDRHNPENGATEFYAVYRNTLSIEKISGQSMKFWGVIRDIGLTIGFDANTKNDAFASQVRELFVGPTVSFDVPGFLTLSLLLDKENNYDGYKPNADGSMGAHVYFDPTYCISLAWGIPILDTPLTFKGFANFIGTKGKETAPETYIEMAIMIDPFYNKPKMKGKFYVGAGWQYWHNKYGVDNSDPAVMGGASANCGQLQVEFHF